MAKSPAIPKALKDATRGLLFPSETDAPVEAFAWPAGPIDATAVRTAAGIDAKAAVQEQSLGDFFRGVPAAERGRYFDLLVALAEYAGGARVFKFGGPRFAVFVVGTAADGRRVGVKTEVVET